MVPEHRRAFGAFRPVVALHVLGTRERSAIGFGAGEYVVLVRRIAASVDDVALLGQRGLLVEVVVAVQLREVLGNHDPFGVLPWALADPVAGVGRRRSAAGTGAEVGVPGVIAGARRRGQALAVLVGTRESTVIGALAGACAGDEESHGRLLGASRACQQRQRCNDADSMQHVGPPEDHGFVLVGTEWR